MDDYIVVGAIEASFEADEVDICDTEMVTFTSTTACADEYSWTFEGGEPETSYLENPDISYPIPGTYDVTLVISNDTDESTLLMEDYITVHNCIGIDDVSMNKMRISPNPGDGHFQIALPDNGVFEVQVFDITGHMVYTSSLSAEMNQMDISHLNDGVYIISANNGTTQFKERVVIR